MKISLSVSLTLAVFGFIVLPSSGHGQTKPEVLWEFESGGTVQ